MFNLILGCGQGGSRLAKEISDTFDIPGRYINLADIDYSSFSVPYQHKLIVDGDGTGRDAALGEAIAKENFDEIERFIGLALAREGYERVCICVGGGGGSGTGMMFPILDYLTSQYKDIKILLLYTLPRKLEGLPAKPQALTYLDRLIKRYMSGKRQISPMLIDNEYVAGLYGSEKDNDYWLQINAGIAGTLRAFFNLTQIDKVSHIDTSAGFGALDFNELMRILFFKNGFIDIRDFEVDYPDVTQISLNMRNSSRVFKDLDVKTCKAYIVAVALPERWKGHEETNEFVEGVFSTAARITKTPYVLRSSFYSRRLGKARVMLMFAGLTQGRGLERIIKQTTKDTEKFEDKESIASLDLSGIKKL